MSHQILPLDDTGAARYRRRIVLDGREYEFLFDWNGREEKWFLSLADEAGTAIVSGIKIVADYPLLRLVTDNRKPPGVLMARDASGAGLDPHFVDLGQRVTMVYVPIEDLETILGSS